MMPVSSLKTLEEVGLLRIGRIVWQTNVGYAYFVGMRTILSCKQKLYNL